MDWKKERDLLIAQTLAFVQSVAGQKADVGTILDAEPPIEAAATEIREIIAQPVVEPSNGVRVSAQMPRMVAASDFRSEIQARVMSFRAHQQRFDREREEYFKATLAKARTALRNETAPPP